MTPKREATTLGIIGRERMLIDVLARAFHGATGGHEVTDVVPTDRGATFRVRIFEGRTYTGRIARVTVDLEGVESMEEYLADKALRDGD